MKYNQDTCNIKNCNCKIYQNFLCKEHFDFYMRNPKVYKVNKEIILLNTKKAGIKLWIKKILHFILHYSLNIPMSLIEHFPLEHIFLTEYYSIHPNSDIHRYNQILKDFDFPENENYPKMQQLINQLYPEDVHIEKEDSYLIKSKDRPSWIFLAFCVSGILILTYLMRGYNSIITNLGPIYYTIKDLYNQYIFYIIALMICMAIGLYIPSLYNPLVKRSYNLSLFKKESDNVNFLTTIKYIKTRKDSGYFSSLTGIFISFALLIFYNFYQLGGRFNFYSILLILSIIMITISLLLWYNIFILYSPVFNCLKRNTIQINLYDTDFKGGLKYYHRFLFFTFLYNEGLVWLCFSILKEAEVNYTYYILAFIILINRCNQGGACIILYIKSVIMLYKTKKQELHSLYLSNDKDSMNKTACLNKISPITIQPLLKSVLLLIIIPYLINQIPEIPQIIDMVKNVIDLIYNSYI